MKKRISQTLLNRRGLLGFALTATYSFSNLTLAAPAGSIDLMCRSKAKEIAAETYKNCVTDIKQSQVKNLRKEYEEKLTALKKHYDNELKKISNGQVSKSNSKANDNIELQNNKPAKDTPSAKDQKMLDLSNNTDESTIEIVEIPAEQE